MNIDDDLLPHMRSVQKAERDMRELGLVWQTIEASASISCPEEVAPLLPTLISTRTQFGKLQDRLIEALAAEHREALADELRARARGAIDILIRNLFERTADVGFLATDEVIAAFFNPSSAGVEVDAQALRERLHAYRAKYTVYEDVIVLDPEGRVRVRLDSSHPTEVSRDPIVAQALARSGWTEAFGVSDLAGQGQPVLLYAHPIAGADGRVHGVLVLHFRFQDELRRIFESLADERGQMAMVLLDADHRVIASSAPLHVPLGASLTAIETDRIALTGFAGQDYLALRCASRGYQGYTGPRWQAQAMIPLLAAFRSRGDTLDATEVPLENALLQGIQNDADDINRELRRVVWNGQLMASQNTEGDRIRLKAVLHQINAAGRKTRNRVSLAVQDLYRTALARAAAQARDLSCLAADLMDRNLYERANDSRWWSLSPSMARSLSEPESDAETLRLNGLLDRLNALYTVYSRILVFDAQGRIRGASRATAAEPVVGRPVPASWQEATRRLSDPQRYAVSPFERCDFHDSGPTYVYLAAIPAGPGRPPLGGVALVFEAKVEFGAMLRDILGDRPGFAAFVDRNGQVLEATDPALATAVTAALSTDMAILEHGGSTWACARSRTSGYREFKREDGYDNGVQCVVGLRLGSLERRSTTLADHNLKVMAARNRTHRVELAVFQVAGGRYALPVEAVMEGIPRDRLVRTPSRLPHAIGMIDIGASAGPGKRLAPVSCARSMFDVRYPSRRDDGIVLVLRNPAAEEGTEVGLRVDDVLAILELDTDRLQTVPLAASGTQVPIGHLVDCALEPSPGSSEATALVQVLDLDAMMQRLCPPVRRALPPSAVPQPA